MAHKRHVEMIVRYLEDGTILQLAARWSEGRLYEIDRVLDVRPCAALKAGGAGIRYTCCIFFGTCSQNTPGNRRVSGGAFYCFSRPGDGGSASPAPSAGALRHCLR